MKLVLGTVSDKKSFRLLQEKSTSSALEIAQAIGMSARRVEKQISKLKEDGVIQRIGPDKGGHWEVCKK